MNPIGQAIPLSPTRNWLHLDPFVMIQLITYRINNNHPIAWISSMCTTMLWLIHEAGIWSCLIDRVMWSIRFTLAMGIATLDSDVWKWLVQLDKNIFFSSCFFFKLTI